MIPKLKSYISDYWDLCLNYNLTLVTAGTYLYKFPKNLDPNFTVSICDIVNLYTNILPELGLRALFYYMIKYRNLIPIRFSKQFILEAAEFVLKNNNFILLEEIFNQVIGTAMTTILLLGS